MVNIKVDIREIRLRKWTMLMWLLTVSIGGCM